MIKEQIIKDLEKVLLKLNVSISELALEHPADSSFGDYSTNIALRTSKGEFTSSIDWANHMVNTWRLMGLPDYLAKVEVVKPGFINLWLKNEVFGNEINEVLKKKDKYGFSLEGEGKTVIIDYSGPNIAKSFGVGHLRSTIIGQALYNIYKFSGWKTIGDNHLGDWGTQFGKLIVAIKRWHKGSTVGLTVEKLEKLYVKFHKEVEKKPEIEDEARAWFKKLEAGDPEAKKIWKACVDISLKEFERVYKILNVKIDYTYGESFYEDKMQAIIGKAKAKKLAVESEGALVIPFSESNMPPAIILKSDGATTYLTRDLATIDYREKRWNPDLYIYEVGADQKLHFKQLFTTAGLLGYGKKSQFVHVAHGLIRWVGGKFSTREGTTIHLEKVLEEAIKKAEKIIKASSTGRGLSESNKKKVATAVGIGAVKYSDLKQNPQTDIIFDWDKIFSLEGDSGPYLQYTYARCQSVAAKDKKEIKLPDTWSATLAPEETALLRTIYKFPETIALAGANFAPNLLCSFLFDLAQKYNLLYNKLSILNPEVNEQQSLKSANEVRERRLALNMATSQILKNGLTLLGVEVLERM